MTDEILNQNIQYLKGVGPSKALLLNKLGINTYRDLLEYYPREYEDRTTFKKIGELLYGDVALFRGTVVTRVSVNRVRKNLSISSFFVEDDGDRIQICIFNQAYIKGKINVGDEYIFFGKVTGGYGRLQVENPIIVGKDKLKDIKGIFPIYPLTKGITNNYLTKLIKGILSSKIDEEEIFDKELIQKYNLCNINDANRKIHFPESFSDVEKARRRIIFEELLLMQLALQNIRNRNLSKQEGIVYKDIDYTRFKELIPFELTNAQKRCVDEILKDMSSKTSMNRLVQGDVGSGKTIVAAIAMFIAVKNGYQAAMMAPTTILANQHFDELNKYFTKLDITADIITGNTTKKNKEKIIQKLKNREIDILFGTHAIIEDNVEFNNLGLIITDEQHRFGVKQRVKLGNKGKNPDIMVMTATPIPRTLSLMLYSDLDMSIIDELPKGRIPIKTYAVMDTLEERINNFICKELDKGRQAYVVCPLIEANEELDLTAAESIYEEYKNNIFSKYNVGFLHGKMKNKEKDEIMNDFKEGKLHMIISTTVIEVGINVPNATLMIIENADRFGLATLHQLRGRVGRGTYESYCILKTKNRSKEALKRLEIMVKSTDGFKIAEKDLELRGPGDYFGVRQHGLPEFKLADLMKDVELLNETNRLAKELLKNDPTLQKIEHIKLRERLYTKYAEQLNNIGT